MPSVATLLGEHFPNKDMRDYLPLMTIIYMGPGGHRQWPISISALLDRLSWLVLQTRGLALTSFQSAVQKNPGRSMWTLHASSSDLITWNTLVMIKLNWVNSIPREWGEITTHSLEEWKARDEKPPFLLDNRRGYARVTPVALSKNGVPGQAMYPVDHYPVEGLRIYEDFESCSHFSGHVWSDWIAKTVQPMHVDDTLQAMIDKPARSGTGAHGIVSVECST